MDFITNTQNNIFIIEVNLTRATRKEAAELKEILLSALEKGWKKIIIELPDIEFIDSTFLGVFVIALKKLNEINGRLRLVGFHPSVHTIVEQTNLHRTFEIFETKEEALNNF